MNSWQSVKLQWPAKSTAWLSELLPVKEQIADSQAATADNLDALASLVPFQENELSKQARAVVTQAETALTEQFSNAPQCLVVTPFTPGVGTGKGYQRYLSAPNLISHFAKKLDDGGDQARPQGEQLNALVVLFLSNTYPQLVKVLKHFNSLLPIEELAKAQRRAGYLAELEVNRQVLPKAGTLPAWQTLPLERLTVVKSIKDNLTAQLSNMQGFINDSPVDTLKQLLATKKASQAANDEALTELKEQLNNQGADAQIIASYLTGGNTSDIRRQLLAITNSPSYDWILCAGALFVGNANSLALLKEVLSL